MTTRHSVVSLYRFAPLIGFFLVLPFMLLEAITTSEAPRSSFPSSLFIFMWFVASVFTLVAQSIIKTVNPRSFTFWFKVLLLILTSWPFVTIVIDQWPCFLGATGC